MKAKKNNAQSDRFKHFEKQSSCKNLKNETIANFSFVTTLFLSFYCHHNLKGVEVRLNQNIVILYCSNM